VTEEELHKLLSGPETENIEFKPKVLDRREIAEYCVGIGNAGGGWLVMGVSDRKPRRVLSIPRPSEEQLGKIRESVADACQIHVSVETVETADGPVVVVRIPRRPPGHVFHTRDGKFLTRLGEELRGMTIEEIDSIRREAGLELTALPLPGSAEQWLSAVGLEELRLLIQEAGASADLVRLSDQDLLQSLGVLSRKDGSLLIAGLLLAGKPEAIRERLPHAQWQFRQMRTDTDYDQAEDGYDCIPVALKRLRALVQPHNPVVTVPGWLVHPEFPRYPVLALREILVNAFVHRDYAVPGAVTLKLYPDRLELSNPGGFVGGVTPENILHHPSAPRYPMLFQALTRMRLANASNLGVPRVYRELLSEGKEPPIYWNSDSAVRVTIRGQDASREFLELTRQYPGLDVDHLLVIHYLTRHREITVKAAAELCQRPREGAREILAKLSHDARVLETGGGSGLGQYYRLTRTVYDLLGDRLGYDVDRRLALENARARVLSVLADRPLSNADVREITQLSRHQALRLMDSLRREGLVMLGGSHRGARWLLRGEQKK
jgi:ATP-dependent DNA helicase RecG